MTARPEPGVGKSPPSVPLSRDRNLARQRRFWQVRASSWEHDAATNPGLVRVVEEVVAEAEGRPHEHAVDLGCGSGQVALSLAPSVAGVLAVDISEEMIRLLLAHAEERGVANLQGRAAPVEHLELLPGSVDVVVSNYALHHLRDPDKAALVRRAFEWLRPGGRLVVGDMMFGLGSDARDREIIASKVSYLAKLGPGGWWRIAKNAARYVLRLQERPVSMRAWEAMFVEAGFEQVRGTRVVNEAAVVRGTKPV